MQALQKPRGSQSITSFSSYCSPPKSGRFLLLCRRAEGLFKSLITIQYNYTMLSASFSIPISAQICNISMNAALFRRRACCPAAFLAIWGRQEKSATDFRRLRFGGWELFYELFYKITPAGNAARKLHSLLAGICDTRSKRG